MENYKFTNLPTPRPATMPSNQKMLDDLLTKSDMTFEDCKQLDKILSNYENSQR